MDDPENWPYNWKLDHKVVRDLAPPPPPRPPAIVGPGRGELLTTEAVLEARQRLTERVHNSVRSP